MVERPATKGDMHSIEDMCDIEIDAAIEQEWEDRRRKRMRFTDERADGLHADTPVCGGCEFPRDACSCANGRDYKEMT